MEFQKDDYILGLWFIEVDKQFNWTFIILKRDGT
jgi:hypothetical protein